MRTYTTYTYIPQNHELRYILIHTQNKFNFIEFDLYSHLDTYVFYMTVSIPIIYNIYLILLPTY